MQKLLANAKIMMPHLPTSPKERMLNRKTLSTPFFQSVANELAAEMAHKKLRK